MAISSITRPDGANYAFQINLDTAFAEATTIRWEIHPTAGAFPLALKTPLTGTLDFSTSETSKMVSPPALTRNHPFPRDFEIQLYNDVDDTLAFTSSEQRIAGDASLPDNSRSISGGGDQNVIGLGLSDTINPASGGSGDDTFIITRFQYGTLEIDDVFTSLSGQNLIKFDYGVTITAYREVSFTLFDVVIDSVTLTLSTGAVVTIALPAGSFGYQLGSGEVLTYADFKTAIGATGMDSLRADYAITSFTDAPELSDPRLEARVARSLSGAGNEDIISAASDYNLTVSGGSGDDVFVVTRFQYGMLEIDDVFTSLSGQNLIKFDYEVTITDYAEVSFTLFDVVIDSVTLTLSTGAVVTIALPAGSFGYQLGSGEVLTYADFKTAIGATGASDLAGDFTISASPVTFTPIATEALEIDENDGTWMLQLAATSEDNDGVTSPIASYEFVGDSNGFTIDNNGLITLTTRFDYEDASTRTHTLTVRATDSRQDPETRDITFTLRVQNLQEGSATYEIAENQAGTMLSVVLFDADPASATYSEDPDGRVGGVSFQWFTTPDGGTTKNDITSIADTTSATLDIEGYTPPSGEIIGVTVSYQDPLNVVAGDRTEFDVLVSPIVFLDGTDPVASYAGSINEDSTAATLPTIAARVDNAPQASIFTYEFVTDVDAGTTNTAHLGFTIDGQGAITFTGTASTDLDYDTDPVRDSITLRVRATYDADGTGNAGAVHTRDVQVVIALTDLNDNTPEIGSLQVEDDPGVIAGFGVAEFGSPTSGADTLTGTTADEYINGGAGLDTITSGGGADHIVGGASNDEITLSSAVGSVETVYYRFSSSTDGGNFVATDGTDTIKDFRRGEDKLVLIDTDGTLITLTDFLSDANRESGGNVFVVPLLDSATGTTLIGVQIDFGNTNALRIEYATDSQVANVRATSGGAWETAGDPYVGVNGANIVSGGVLNDNTLLLNYFGTGDHDNLLIADDAYLETIVPDVLIAETFTSADGVFASVSATDADGTSPNNQVSYSITGGTGMGIFEINPTNGGISVASGMALDYETAPISYTLTIEVSDGTNTATQDITIELTDVNDSDPTATTGGTQTFAERTAVTSDTPTGFFITISDLDTGVNINDHNVVVIGIHASRFKFVEDGTTANQWNLVLIDGQEVDREAGYVINDLLTVEYQITDGTRYTSPSNSVGITITDINDNRPVVREPDWEGSPLESGVPDNVGTTQLFIVRADDADKNQSSTFRIVSVDGVGYTNGVPDDGSSALFAIQPISGRFGVIGNLDHEVAQSHTIVFEAIDPGGMVSDPKEVVVTVINVDEGDATYAITGATENNGSLSVAVTTADPDGLVANSESYRWFILNTDGSVPAASDANGDIADAGSDDGNDATLKLPADVSNNVYGVVVTYMDNAGETERVTVTARAASPARIPDRPEPITHDPYDPDELGLTPLPDADPNAG